MGFIEVIFWKVLAKKIYKCDDSGLDKPSASHTMVNN